MAIKTNTVMRWRLKRAAAEEGLTQSQMITAMLDYRDARKAAARARQPSPLHRPRKPQVDGAGSFPAMVGKPGATASGWPGSRQRA